MSGSSSRAESEYVALVRWIHEGLDAYKGELMELAYPLFLVCYINMEDHAGKFFDLFRVDHENRHRTEMEDMAAAKDRSSSTKDNPTFTRFLSVKYRVSLTPSANALLLAFMSEKKLHVLPGYLASHIIIRVVDTEDPVYVASHGTGEEASRRFAADSLALSPLYVGHVQVLVSGVLSLPWGAPLFEHQLSALPAGEEPWAVAGVGGPLPMYNSSDFGKTLLLEALSRITIEDATAQAEDVRKRLPVSVGGVTAACFTFASTFGRLSCVTFSKDATLVVAGFSDSVIRIWNLKAGGSQVDGSGVGGLVAGDEDAPMGEPVAPTHLASDERNCQVLVGHKAAVCALCLSDDATYLLSGGMDGVIRLWVVGTQHTAAVYRFHNFPVWDLKFCPLSASLFVSASRDGLACLWNMAGTKPCRLYAGHALDVNCVAFHPNSFYIVTGSADSTVRFWDLQTGKAQLLLSGHTSGVTAVAVSPDGRFIASAAHDYTVRLWDLMTQSPLRVLTGHNAMICTLAFSAEGAAVVSGSIDGVLHAWDVRKVLDSRDPASRDAAKSTTVLDTRFGRVISSDCLMSTMHTKSSRVLGCQFSSRNVLLVAADFPA